MTKTVLKLLLPSSILAGLLLSSAFCEGLNKWVDEKGQIHYGDRVPAKYLGKEHSRLNEQGITVRTTRAMKSERELDEEKRRQAIKMQVERERLIEARKKMLRDRVLLDTFTAEKDLVIARDTRIEALDSQISLAKTLISHDEKKLAGIKKRIKKIRNSGRKPPENLLKSEASVSRQLGNNHAYVKERNNERSEILKKFKEDFRRFRELMKKKREAKLKSKQLK